MAQFIQDVLGGVWEGLFHYSDWVGCSAAAAIALAWLVWLIRRRPPWEDWTAVTAGVLFVVVFLVWAGWVGVIGSAVLLGLGWWWRRCDRGKNDELIDENGKIHLLDINPETWEGREPNRDWLNGQWRWRSDPSPRIRAERDRKAIREDEEGA